LVEIRVRVKDAKKVKGGKRVRVKDGEKGKRWGKRGKG
jgi:hypothetical protein